MRVQEVKGEWSTALGTAAGCGKVAQYECNPQYLLRVERDTDLILRVKVGTVCCICVRVFAAPFART